MHFFFFVACLCLPPPSCLLCHLPHSSFLHTWPMNPHPPHLLYPLILPSITVFPLCSFILHPQPPLSFSSQLSERVPILRSWQHSLDRNQPPWGIWTVERCVTGTCQKLCDSLWVFHRGSLMGCTCMCFVWVHVCRFVASGRAEDLCRPRKTDFFSFFFLFKQMRKNKTS